MKINKNENIAINVQLIKANGTSVETDATITYSIYDSEAKIELASGTTTYNSSTQSYLDTLVPSASWTSQDVGSYIIVYTISDTDDDFNDVYSENIEIGIDADVVNRILGLCHQNILIDDTDFDTYGNLVSARVRIYMDSAKTQLISTYAITASGTTSPGVFTTWQSVEN